MEREEWLRSLVLRVHGPKVDMEKIVAVVLPTLQDIGPDAFNATTLQALAGSLRSVQSAYRVRKALFDLHARATPTVDPYPGADDPSLTWGERITLQIWLNHRSQGFPHVPDTDDRRRMTVALDIHRQHMPRVFRYICRTDLEAASIAVQHGWEVEPQPRRPPTQAEIDAVSASVRDAHAAMLAPPLYQRPVPATPDPPSHAPGPRHLTPADLDRINPLPHGRKRTDDQTTTAPADRTAGMAGHDGEPPDDWHEPPDDWRDPSA
jgi:hypothetical protein